MKKYEDFPKGCEHTHLHTYALNTQTIWALKWHGLHPRLHTNISSSFQQGVSPLPGPGVARENRQTWFLSSRAHDCWRRLTLNSPPITNRFITVMISSSKSKHTEMWEENASTLTNLYSEAEETGSWEGCESGFNIAIHRNYHDFPQFARLIQKPIFNGKKKTCFKYVCISLLIWVDGQGAWVKFKWVTEMSLPMVGTDNSKSAGEPGWGGFWKRNSTCVLR